MSNLSTNNINRALNIFHSGDYVIFRDTACGDDGFAFFEYCRILSVDECHRILFFGKLRPRITLEFLGTGQICVLSIDIHSYDIPRSKIEVSVYGNSRLSVYRKCLEKIDKIAVKEGLERILKEHENKQMLAALHTQKLVDEQQLRKELNDAISHDEIDDLAKKIRR